ncbi:MAG: 5-formyltetrahydrofolate cyclo-ligase [Spirochaetia bacterium]|nr:5-formyltetrahydrofolate cyclo-ligase [Spirochaetia bacterium]NCC90173.1 5-formyltetrahydrofolate cyclo-ligase [Spirochaetia bacterium]
METKRALRSAIRAQGTRDFQEEDSKSCRSLLGSNLYAGAHSLFAFFPLRDEADITEVLQDALAHKVLALPVSDADGTLHFFQVFSFETLQKGRFGIAEPQPTRELFPTQEDLLLVPAVAYTRQGQRLGRGKGYYDRFLSHHTGCPTLGICRSHQLVETLPEEEHDKRVAAVLCAGVFY